ncbi:hypothetical protein [Dinoroseobacter sp. S375]|uniref:hypothetical protein n=1 Tax=Dinoroseobacter sp. S375 TaxID=3415136 RepID=UPI003C7CC0BC
MTDMDAKTLEALKASIAKWEKNARVRKAENAKLTVIDCPLCDLFHKLGCEGCPVAERTGEISCWDTPYEHAYHERGEWLEDASRGPLFRAAAREEVAFLKSLLPEAEQ